MKNLKTFHFVFALLVTLSACKKTDNDIQPSLSINPVQKELESGQGNFLVAVTSNVKWTASTDKSWMSLSPVSGTGDGTIQVDYQINTSATPRTAVITFKGSNLEDKYLTVTQLGVLPFLTVTPANQNVSAGAGNTTFAVSSNTTWVVSSNLPWCTLSQYSATGNVELIASYQENTLPNERIAKLTFTVPGLDDQYATVTQAAFVPSLFVSPSNQNVGSAAGSTTFSVAANIAWTATSNQGWCTINTGATGNGTINANFTENTSGTPRTDSITVVGVGVMNQIVTVTQQSSIPTQGLVAYYPFNGDANDESGNNLNGTIHGTSLTTDRKGEMNKAYYFNGTSNYIEVPHNALFDFGMNDFSITIWFKTSFVNNNSGFYPVLIMKEFVGSPRNGWGIVMLPSSNKVQAEYWVNNSVKSVITNSAANDNKWHFIVAKRVNVSTFSLYFDNSFIGSKTISGSANNTNSLFFGNIYTHFYEGALDDIRIYNRALSDSEIQQLYNE